MATEILSLDHPGADPGASDEPDALVVSEDLSISGKARKKRFRLR